MQLRGVKHKAKTETGHRWIELKTSFNDSVVENNTCNRCNTGEKP